MTEMSDPDMTNLLHQVAIRADDLDRAVDFYSKLLGQDPVAVFDPPGLAFFNLGTTRLLLDRGAPSSLIYLRVADVRARTEELRAQGIEIVNEPHVIFSDVDGTFGEAWQDEWMSFFHDSEGNLVGLASREQCA